MASRKEPASLRELPSMRQLRAFVAVYRTGHLSAAAEMLSVTPPAISVLIRELEEKLGVRLFDRTTRSLRRTEAAVETIGFAERALGELAEMGRAAGDLALSRRGHLRVAATSTIAQTVLPGIWRRFLNTYPNIKLTIDDCAPSEFVERIASDRVDCGIGTLEAPIPGLAEQVFLRDSLVAAALPSEQFPAGRPMTWSQLSKVPVITVRPGYGVRQRIDLAAIEANVELRVEHEVSLLTTALALAAGGLGVSVVPGTIVEYAPHQRLVSRPLTKPRVSRDTAVIFKSDREMSPVTTAFIRMLKGTH